MGDLMQHRKQAGASLIGSIAGTREVLEFCAARNIGPDIEIIPIQDQRRLQKVKKDDFVLGM